MILSTAARRLARLARRSLVAVVALLAYAGVAAAFGAARQASGRRRP